MDGSKLMQDDTVNGQIVFLRRAAMIVMHTDALSATDH